MYRYARDRIAIFPDPVHLTTLILIAITTVL